MSEKPDLNIPPDDLDAPLIVEFNFAPQTVPADVVRAIYEPHQHENEDWNKPVWLIMASRCDGDGWAPYCICSDARSAVIHFLMYTCDYHGWKIHVERVPMNHAFGSEMLTMMWKENRRLLREWRENQMQQTGRYIYPREGD